MKVSKPYVFFTTLYIYFQETMGSNITPYILWFICYLIPTTQVHHLLLVRIKFYLPMVYPTLHLTHILLSLWTNLLVALKTANFCVRHKLTNHTMDIHNLVVNIYHKKTKSPCTGPCGNHSLTIRKASFNLQDHYPLASICQTNFGKWQKV